VPAGPSEPSDNARLRPGMEGVAKIEIERRSLLFVATRRLVDWWTLQLWELGLS
jgi:hypothetical protein